MERGRMKRNGDARRSGFTLTEVLMATFMLTVGLLATTSTMVAVYHRQTLSGSVMSATNLAQTKLENLKASTYDEVQSDTEEYGEIADHAKYRRVTTVSTNADDTLKDVRVLVQAASGTQVELSSLIARR
ncbi:MAG: prepilin-type N-terminal cleavage/methylation domain-containing protein [Deltaproteobacteria bacterium]|nr:prepilin-type N-terminal cleavage/methylation domain-containing protein [Deltaproteobacteria bacterium]